MAKWVKQSYHEKKMEEKVLMPYTYQLQLRVYGFLGAKLTDAFDYWLNIPKDKLEIIKKMMSKLTNSLALLDDLQDDSLYRRIQPAAHRVFGNALAINACIHGTFLALKDIMKLGHPKGAELYCEGFLTFLRGQGLSIYFRENQCHVTQDDYNQMTVNQSGFLIVFIVKLMQLFSDNETDYEYLAKIFGLYYQMRDDYVDLKKPEAVEEGARIQELKSLSTMTFCEDFTEGKISPAVIHALKGPHRDVILGILKMRTRDMKTKEYLLSLLEESGSIQKIREILRELEADILSEIRRLGGNPLFEALMRDLQTWDE